MTNVGLQSYIKELAQDERVMLKNYIAFKFRKSYFTVNEKFAGRQKFSATELLALQPIIANELWRQ